MNLKAKGKYLEEAGEMMGAIYNDKRPPEHIQKEIVR